MSWMIVKIPCAGNQAESLCDALIENGAISTSIEDAHAQTPAEQPVLVESIEPFQLWHDCLVTAMFPENFDIDGCIAQLSSHFEWINTYPITMASLAEQDWVQLGRKNLQPMQISSRLWIVPSWHQARHSQAVSVIIDPGLAFGSGSDPTTRLCLQMLSETILGDEIVLDYGCGSGILAIASAKLGAKDVFGVDVDPHALAISQENAKQNHVRLKLFLPHEVPELSAHIVVANILSKTLKTLAPHLAKYTHHSGAIILSGILEDQADQVISAYAPWFNFDLPVELDGWICLKGYAKF